MRDGARLTGPRILDLYGRTRDDQLLVLWQRGVPVVPISAFPRIGCWIQSGHYVIDYMGDAIVVHCGNNDVRQISVLFVIGEPVEYTAARSTIEPMLLGRLVISKEQRATVFEQRPAKRLRVTDFSHDEM